MRLIYSRDNASFIKFFRSKGVKIGENCEFFGRLFIDIDLTRPSLIQIGNNVVMTKGVTILTHGYDWCVLREKYGTSLGYAQPVLIGDNVFIGQHVKILPGVTIGNNCIIGVGSIVTKNLESDYVYAGVPAKKIKSIQEYYADRLDLQIKEAVNFGISIIERFGRMPIKEDFNEFFELFLERDEAKFGGIPVKEQTRNKFENFMASKPFFMGFEHFLDHIILEKRNREFITKRK